MRILMLSPVVPWPLSAGGGHVRIFHILRGLSNCFATTFVAPTTDTDESVSRILTEATGARIVLVKVARHNPRLNRLASLVSLMPYHVSHYFYPEMLRTIENLINTEDFALTYLHFMYPMAYLPPTITTPLVVDQQNVDREYWQRKIDAEKNPSLRLLLRWNLSKVIRYEQRVLRRISAYVSVSERDKHFTEKYARPFVPYFFVAPNGVDLCYFRASGYEKETQPRTITLGFMGSMNLVSNTRAAVILVEEILPLVRSRVPSQTIRCLLIGRNPSSKVLSLARTNSEVTVTGTVPDVRPYLNQVDIFVVPLSEGAGSKLRVLEAMASGIAIVGSAIALQGIDGVRNFENARAAHSPTQFAEAIVELIENPPERERLGRNAKRLVTEQYSWSRITSRLGRELQQVTGAMR